MKMMVALLYWEEDYKQVEALADLACDLSGGKQTRLDELTCRAILDDYASTKQYET